MSVPNNREHAVGLWDVTFKRLLRLRPQDLLALVPAVPADRPLRLCDKEFSPRPGPKALDGCLEVESADGGTLYHVEFEATPRGDTALRVFEHFALAHCGHGGRAVRPVVFYLTPGTEGRQAADRHRIVADGRVICDFRFEAVRLWEIDADDLLARPAPALWAVIALARGASLGHVGRACEQLGRAADSGLRRELYAVLYMVAGTRFEPQAVRALLPREVLMRSATYDEIVREGEERGLIKGWEAGRLEGLRHACRRMALSKLTALPPEFEVRLEAMADPAALEALLVDLGSAADPAAALALLERLGP